MANIFKPPCDDGVIQSGPCTSPCPKGVGPWILVATIIGSSMLLFDGTAVEVQWIVESYMLFLAALLPVGGSMGDRFGRRRIVAGGTAVFAAASGWCGLAPDALQLIIARAVRNFLTRERTKYR